ncbi:pentapeptide repeat-containing protein [Planobispora siamensis]|nr:pentapeptide repeat-containing protein [Planobispora siamensis]
MRALVWIVGSTIIAVIATAILHLHTDPSSPNWRLLITQALPRYLIPPYSAAYVPLVVLTIMGMALATAALTRLAKRALSSKTVPPLQVLQADADRLQGKERFDALAALRAMRLQTLNTWGVILGVAFTAGSLVFTSLTLTATQDAQITDRYNKAVEQLSKNSLDVRIGAIYALERIAKDSTDDRHSITAVLATYVREHDPEPQEKMPAQPTPDLQAALTVLERNAPDDPDLGWLDLRGIRVQGIELSRAHLFGVILSRANLTDAALPSADLSSADLTHAILTNAILNGADLSDADLTGASAVEVTLSNADLTGASLSGATLTDATLIGATLDGADLSSANLTGALLSGATLNGADLSSADLRHAQGLPPIAELKKIAIVDNQTRF